MSKSEKKSPFVGWFYAAFCVATLIFLNALLSLLFLTTEDIIQKKLASAFFFFPTYALSVASLLVFGLILIGMIAYEQKLIREASSILENGARLFWLRALFYVSSFAICWPLVYLLVLFLEGSHASSAKYLEALIWIFCASLGALVPRLELSFPQLLYKRWYGFVLVGAIIFIIFSSFWTMFMYAPPALLQEARAENRRVENVDNQYHRFERFLKERRQLPKSLKQLWRQDIFEGIAYTPLSSNSFKLCTPLKTPKLTRRRLAHAWTRIPQTGEHCKTYAITLKKRRD